MVKLNRIYTRTGDGGDTGLTTGERVRKYDLRVAAYGDVDETNACIGLVRQQLSLGSELDAMLERIQNELFDLGADLSTPERGVKGFEPLRVTQGQVDRLEREIDRLNGDLAPLTLLRPAWRLAPRPRTCIWRGPSAGAPSGWRCELSDAAGRGRIAAGHPIPESAFRFAVRHGPLGQ